MIYHYQFETNSLQLFAHI